LARGIDNLIMLITVSNPAEGTYREFTSIMDAHIYLHKYCGHFYVNVDFDIHNVHEVYKRLSSERDLALFKAYYPLYHENLSCTNLDTGKRTRIYGRFSMDKVIVDMHFEEFEWYYNGVCITEEQAMDLIYTLKVHVK
jgi:hypothetical protein